MSPFSISGAASGASVTGARVYFGTTPGGAQDIGFFRMAAGDGTIPHPNTITAEGLFSEHDLPLNAEGGCEEQPCVEDAAMEARLAASPGGILFGAGGIHLGVGVQFGAEMAEKISSLRGGIFSFSRMQMTWLRCLPRSSIPW